jgi:hypothetical protein
MEDLRLLLIQNHSLLDKLRVRGAYCSSSLALVESDHHKQYGPFAGFWDEWLVEVSELHSLITEHTTTNSFFLTELREFIQGLESKKRLSKADVSYLVEVKSLTADKLAEQRELLAELDERIGLHRQITKQLMLVEAIDSLEE